MRYALIAYVVTFVGVTAVAVVLYFGAGVQLHVGAGVLVVDASTIKVLRGPLESARYAESGVVSLAGMSIAVRGRRALVQLDCVGSTRERAAHPAVLMASRGRETSRARPSGLLLQAGGGRGEAV